MDSYISLKTLTIDELAGVVNLYPWFGNARKELCRRLSKAGDDALSDGMLADAALYVPSRKLLSDMNRARPDCSDKDIESVLKSYISGNGKDASSGEGRHVYVIGGDYFSQKQYDQVKMAGGTDFPEIGRAAAAEDSKGPGSAETAHPGFYTETLARIYAEQGYPEQAKEIYSKLILAYPEKNAYFAALIRELEQES